MSDLTAIEKEASLMRVSRPNNLNDVECPLHGFQVFSEERRKQRCHRKLTAQNLMLAALDFLMGHKQQVQDLVYNPGPTADKMSSR